jgi:hypothetical protein
MIVEEATNDQIEGKWVELLENHFARIFYLLRSYRVKRLNSFTVQVVAAFLAYHILGFRSFTEQMIRWVVRGEKAEAHLMATLHRLADFKVISVIRTDYLDHQPYRFIMVNSFLEHIGEFWREA